MKHRRNETRNLLRLPILHTAIASIHVAWSVLLEGELLSLHAKLVCVALAHSLHRSTTLLDDVSTNNQHCKSQQFILKFLKHHLVVGTGWKIRLVHSEKQRTGVRDEGGVHEEIVEVPVCQEKVYRRTLRWNSRYTPFHQSGRRFRRPAEYTSQSGYTLH